MRKSTSLLLAALALPLAATFSGAAVPRPDTSPVVSVTTPVRPATLVTLAPAPMPASLVCCAGAIRPALVPSLSGTVASVPVSLATTPFVGLAV